MPQKKIAIHRPELHMRDHLAAQKPVALHKGHALLAVSVFTAELTLHVLEASMFIMVLTFMTFFKDLGEAVERCAKRCRAGSE